MFRAVLSSQWRESRLAVVLLAGLALAFPLLSLRGASSASDPWSAWDLLRASTAWSVSYPIVALAAALALAAGAWLPDRRGRHVYALTLPVSRSRYLLLRFAAGLLLLLGIGAVLGVSASVAAARTTLPPLLHAYPLGLALRFCLAGVAAYTLLFSLIGLTPRAARLIVAAILILIILGVAADLLNLKWNPLVAMLDAVFGPYSPLTAFRARWMLIDV
jgi:hypothetical protein